MSAVPAPGGAQGSPSAAGQNGTDVELASRDATIIMSVIPAPGGAQGSPSTAGQNGTDVQLASGDVIIDVTDGTGGTGLETHVERSEWEAWLPASRQMATVLLAFCATAVYSSGLLGAGFSPSPVSNSSSPPAPPASDDAKGLAPWSVDFHAITIVLSAVLIAISFSEARSFNPCVLLPTAAVSALLGFVLDVVSNWRQGNRTLEGHIFLLVSVLVVALAASRCRLRTILSLVVPLIGSIQTVMSTVISRCTRAPELGDLALDRDPELGHVTA